MTTLLTETRDFLPTTPGQILARTVGEAEGKITQQELAAALSVSRFTVNQIINGHRAITPDMAVRLEYVLGTSAEFWLQTQMRLDLFRARSEVAAIEPDLTRLLEPQLEPPTD